MIKVHHGCRLLAKMYIKFSENGKSRFGLVNILFYDKPFNDIILVLKETRDRRKCGVLPRTPYIIADVVDP